MRDRKVQALGAALIAAAVLPAMASGQSWRDATMSRQIAGESAVEVQVDYTAGRFTVGPADSGLLYDMRVRYDEEVFEPRAEYRNGRLELGVEGSGRSINLGKGRSGGEMHLALARGVPMDLSLDFGAVRADLDLGGISLTGLDVETGASESTVEISELNPVRMRRASFRVGAADFTARHLGNLNTESVEVDAGVGEVTLWLTGDWQSDARVSVDMGLGRLELRIPEGLGIRLTKDSFLTSLDSQGLIKRGDAWYSPDWDQAERQVSIDLDTAFGAVEVVWVR